MINKFKVRFSSSWICIHAVLIIGICSIFNLSYWKRCAVIQTDAISYYAYLPAVFIYHDLSLGFLSAPNRPKVDMWPVKAGNGKMLIKTTMGMSLFYSPLFFAAQISAPFFQDAPSGYSPVYHFFLDFAGLLYFYLGLLVLRRILLRYFSEGITTLTLLCVALGTNVLYYYTVETMSAHTTGFFLLNVFILNTIRWHEEQKLRYILYLGITLGLLTLIRPTHLLVLVLFFLLQVRDWESLKSKFRLLYSHKFSLLLIPFLVVLIFLPQMLYWKMQTGHYLFNSYVGESFYFSSPHIVEGLFGYRKGWLVYTPLMSFFFAGLFVLPDSLKDWRPGIIIFFCGLTYMMFSWWCWWYGGSFGMRTYIDFYGIFALGLAAFWSRLFQARQKIYRYSIGCITGLLLLLNMFQTYQYKRGVIHYDSMTRQKYWAVFGKLGPETNDSDRFLKAPDYAKAWKGEEE